ncbi:MAG: PVC-type heme-binding CxxCH protein, partial [Limisphaerales bacterium]
MKCNWFRPGAGFRLAVLLSLFLLPSSHLSAETNSFPQIHNTEKSTNAFLSPKEAAEKFQMPPGFKATLFAGEPDVRQPIAMTFDDRGRLWVAENYTYADNGSYDTSLRDRLVIFEDIDGDGQFDKRTVFWDKAQKLTSVAIGFGGVWVLCAPNLLFIPDRNGDDIPDSEPEVILDGWQTKDIQHNIVNGLMWGPDGWLYGRHGILATSAVGRPGTPEHQRVKINCGIWRYHPTRKTFEVVAHGTTNPWGMDFDEHGEAFFINTVIGHLWHLIPGAHYRRMYGQDLNPHAYELIDQHADHYHWDTGLPWQETRDGKGLNDTLGGGHAHSGLMIYLGDNWPDRFRNSVYAINLHGYRLNRDLLHRRGSGYVGKHGLDFAKTSDIWFRAVDLTYGPDGGVYVMDWSDTGECHEADGVHRSSGRIYKIAYGEPKKPELGDLSKLSNNELVPLIFHKNEWFSRRARRVLQERASNGANLKNVHSELLAAFEEKKEAPAKLRAMWALHVSGGTTDSWLRKQFTHPNEYVRTWAIRFATEQRAPVADLAHVAREDSSAHVRLAVASALQRLPLTERAMVAAGLIAHSEDAEDHNLPLMIWYGIVPLGDSAPAQLVQLANDSKIPLVRKLIARRLAENLEKNPEPVSALVQGAAALPDTFQFDVVQGISEGLHGWREADAPGGWTRLRESVGRSSNQQLKDMVRDLSLIFGDETVIAELKEVARNESAEAQNRREALQRLIHNKPPQLLPFLESAITNKT